MADLRSRFIEIWNEIGARTDPSEAFTRLRSFYGQPGRFYHNMEHIGRCIDELDPVKEKLDNPQCVELAIWFHDVAYGLGEKDDEEVSANIAFAECRMGGLPSERATRVRELVLSTRLGARMQSSDQEYLHDIDYAILGTDRETYQSYTAALRKESRFNNDQFNAARFFFLDNLLKDKKDIYYTPHFKERYGMKALINITEEHGRLR